MSNNPSLNTKFERNNDIISSEMGGETVMMSIENGKYFSVNPVGSRIWELLHSPQTVAQLVDTLLDEYEIDRATCEKEVINFLTHMESENVVRKSE